MSTKISLLPLLDAADVAADDRLVVVDTSVGKTKGLLASAVVLTDGSSAMAANLDVGGHAVTNVGTVDGRDVSADGAVLDALGTTVDANATKLDGIEAGADKTDAENVAAAGALMADGSATLTADLPVADGHGLAGAGDLNITAAGNNAVTITSGSSGKVDIQYSGISRLIVNSTGIRPSVAIVPTETNVNLGSSGFPFAAAYIGMLRAGDGNLTTPSMAFASDLTSGFAPTQPLGAAGFVGIVGGVTLTVVSAAGFRVAIDGSAAAPCLAVGADGIGFSRDGDDLVVSASDGTDGVEVAKLTQTMSSGETALLIRHNASGTESTVARVTVGDIDSGGTGFRALRIPN